MRNSARALTFWGKIDVACELKLLGVDIRNMWPVEPHGQEKGVLVLRRVPNPLLGCQCRARIVKSRPIFIKADVRER